jgi:DinB family
MKRSAVVAVALRSFSETPGLRFGRVGLEMLYYMLSHEAHHRGKVCMLAHQLGFSLPVTSN